MLDIATTRTELMRRVTDLAKITNSARQELSILTQMSEALVADRSYHMQSQVAQNTSEIRNIVTTNTNIHHTLNMLQSILCGLFAFALLDRVTGTWTVTNREWATALVETLFAAPYLFLGFNMVTWLVVAYVCARMISNKSANTAMFAQVKIVLDEKIKNTDRFAVWVTTKTILFEDATWELDRNNTKCMWQEDRPMDWGGCAPRIEIEYDSEHGYLFAVTVYYSKATGKLTPSELRARVMDELKDWDIIEEAAFMQEGADDEEEDD